ncbi:MAG: high frequency lysogenization protein HflD [Gammaproteobacteria bacterium]|nr:high frequency lysogenization protein HflD [Gammaproteobacteria bacterium]
MSDHDSQQGLERVLALGGVFQAVSLVQQLAREGRIDSAPYAVSIESLFTLDAPSTEAIYGGKSGLRVGLEVLCRQLDSRQDQRDMEVARYWVELLFLERKLVKDTTLLNLIRDGIDQAETQATHFSKLHENVVARLAEIYKTTVSTLTPRIMVGGEPQFLHQPSNANQIRALLLSAMRSTILWRQLGGTRLGLLFGRKQIVNVARTVLADLAANRIDELPGGPTEH